MQNWEPRGTWQKLLDVFQPFAAVARRQNFIETFEFPTGVRERFAHARSLSSSQDLLEVESALRDYFQICRIASGEMISMPSQVADDLWHEFVLHTRLYAVFCDLAFGHFLHHSPAGALANPGTMLDDGMVRAWIRACERQKINPYQPDRLPRLFALDAKLGATDGFTYDKDEMAAKALRAKQRQQLLSTDNSDALYGNGTPYGRNYASNDGGAFVGGSSDGTSSFSLWGHHGHHGGHHSSHDSSNDSSSNSGHGSHGHSDGGSSAGHGGHSGCGGGGHGGHGCGGGGCGGHGGGH